MAIVPGRAMTIFVGKTVFSAIEEDLSALRAGWIETEEWLELHPQNVAM